jgi:hypothetical protein
MTYDARTLEQLPYGRGLLVPVLLSAKNGMDKVLLDLMRGLFNAGLRPAALSRILMELHTKAHTHAYLQHEFDFQAERDGLGFGAQSFASAEFSTFHNKSGYAGKVCC